MLDRHVAQRAIRTDRPPVDKGRDLQNLAAKTNQQDTAKVGVLRIARQRAEQRVIAFILAGHAAPCPVADRNDAVDVGKVIQQP